VVVDRVVAELARIAPRCAWTAGEWRAEDGSRRWKELENIPKHVTWLSNHLARTYVQTAPRFGGAARAA